MKKTKAEKLAEARVRETIEVEDQTDQEGVTAGKMASDAVVNSFSKLPYGTDCPVGYILILTFDEGYQAVVDEIVQMPEVKTSRREMYQRACDHLKEIMDGWSKEVKA